MAAPSGREGPDDTECVSRACFDTQTWVKRFGKKKVFMRNLMVITNSVDSVLVYQIGVKVMNR